MSIDVVVARIGQIHTLIHPTASWRAGSPASPFGTTGTARADTAETAADAQILARAAALGPGGLPQSGPPRFVDVLDVATLRALSARSEAPGSQASPATGTAPTGETDPLTRFVIPSAAIFTSPLPDATLTQPFGPTDFALEPPITINGTQYAHFHAGIDLARPLGTPVLAAASGTVIAAGRASDGAVIVRIRHADGSETLYGHLQSSLSVKVGDTVTAGERIGSVGMTGNTTGPHLHFALYAKNGTPVDPQASLDAGRLPGQVASAGGSGSAGAAAGAASSWRCTAAGLARFDAVSSRIPYASLIRSAAANAGIDPLLLASVVNAESAFQPRVVSGAGAMGLMQLMPATARSLGVTDPFDPAQSLDGGARYLASQLNRFGRVDFALAAYQAGPSLVASLGAVPDYPSTRAYIQKILATWAGYAESAS